MTKEEKKKISLARAKRTALGRFLCRLFGDNAGQTLMEYVVLGVMVVAAVVAIVLVFGEQIREAFYSMKRAITGSETPQRIVDDSQALGTGHNVAHPGASNDSSPSGGNGPQ